jgi:Xaa-Pro aminopeptidase
MLEEHRDIQNVAKLVLEELGPSIRSVDTERSIANRAVCLLEKHGITETWYHDCPALVLSGSRSCLSVSGKNYRPSDEPIGAFNMVTIDLSPLKAGIWGDFARSFFVEEGKSSIDPRACEFIHGMETEFSLHKAMLDYVTADTTFDELYQFANHSIVSKGYENLDYLNNLGHSIVDSLEERIYIENGNTLKLCDVEYFTFEPHVRKSGGSWGFKHENIYYFGLDGHAREL